MVNSALRPDAGLGEVLATAARSTSDAKLAGAAVGGTVSAAALFFWQPAGWFYALAIALCVAAFGAWGVADRELHDTRTRAWRVPPVMLHGVRILAAIVGALAVAAFLAAVLGVGLGRIIS